MYSDWLNRWLSIFEKKKKSTAKNIHLNMENSYFKFHSGVHFYNQAINLWKWGYLKGTTKILR